MLTIKQVVKLYENGFEIRIRKKPHPNGAKGEFDPSTLEGVVFLPAIESPEDKDITILHETVHGRNGILDGTIGGNERMVEREAKAVYYKRHYVLEFLKWLYKIR